MIYPLFALHCAALRLPGEEKGRAVMRQNLGGRKRGQHSPLAFALLGRYTKL